MQFLGLDNYKTLFYIYAVPAFLRHFLNISEFLIRFRDLNSRIFYYI